MGLCKMLQRTPSSKFAFLSVVFCVTLLLTLFELQILRIENNQENLGKIIGQLQESINQKDQTSIPSNQVIIYNRIPKTGSTSFMGVAYDLCKNNGFHVLHINVTGNNHALTFANQFRFVQNVTYWNSMKPAIFHGHVAFVDFSRFGTAQKPLYINIVREPLDRLVSYYYFLRFGDDFRPHLVRKKHGDKITFDECVQKKLPDCHPNNMWKQIPFFCGHSPDCWKIGNEWALAEAKRNLHENYFLVGVTNEISEFVQVLEETLPTFFRGAVNIFETSNKSHLRKTSQKRDPLEETVNKIKTSKIWKMENELYEYALEKFHDVKRQVLEKGDRVQNFFYEKIRPH